MQSGLGSARLASVTFLIGNSGLRADAHGKLDEERPRKTLLASA